MSVINTIFGVPLGYLMYFSYWLIDNYGLSIILFTLFTKILMLPLSLSSQKNSVIMVKIKPQLEEIKSQYSGNPNLILAEQKKLYKKEKYNTWIGILPLLIQIPIILGLINVIYNPLQHLIHLNADTIKELAARLTDPAIGQIELMKSIQSTPELFSDLLSADQLVRITGIDFGFLGLDLATVPVLASILVIIPILSGLSSFLLSALQNRYNVLQREQGPGAKWGMLIFLVAFSTYFAFLVPAGIGVYWIAGNLLSIPVLFFCNAVYDAKKLIDYENRPQRPTLTPEEKRQAKAEKKAKKQKERECAKQFLSIDKRLVFYSESNGFYKYFESIIDYLLANSDLDIHYVTSDINDNIFNHESPRIHPYYIGDRKLIAFMMRMDADMVVMTMPDLDQYHIKRSLVKKDVEYIYLDHGMTSFHLMLREHALDAYDTIFCYGPNHIEEIRETEKVYGLKPKNLVKTGYALLDTLLESVSSLPMTVNDPKRILIAPSWQKDNLIDFCLDELLEQILPMNYTVILRPHPEYIKRFPDKMKAIYTKYEEHIGENFVIEDDFSSNTTVYTSDLIVTDWSSIAQEFSYTTHKPSLFINTPMKIMNPNYQKIAPVPLDISLRDEIGAAVDVEDFDKLPGIIEDMINNKDRCSEQIRQVVEDNIYNIGTAAKASGDYIISRLKEKEESKKDTTTL